MMKFSRMADYMLPGAVNGIKRDMHENGEDKEPPRESIINEEEDGSISILFIYL